MSEDSTIKAISEHSCPNCKQKIFIEIQMTPSYVNSIFTPEQVTEAKKDAVERIDTLAIDPDKKQEVIKWIMNSETLFGPSEVDNIVQSLLKPEE